VSEPDGPECVRGDSLREPSAQSTGLLDWLISPATRARGEDETRRARVLIGASIATLLVVPGFTASYQMLLPAPLVAPFTWSLAAVLVFHLAMLALLRRTERVERVGHAMCAASVGLLAYHGWLSGGASSAATVLLAYPPLLALTVMGFRAGLYWGATGVLCILGLFVAPATPLAPYPHGIAVDVIDLYRALTTATLIWMIVALGYAYDLSRTAALTSASRAEAAALAASRAKSEFVANMSHEIRTPMTAILGYAEALEERLAEGPLGPESREMIDAIQRNGRHLVALINDILDISKIEAGRLEVEQIAVDPFQLVEEVRSLVSVRTASKHLEFRVIAQGRIPLAVRTDPTRLRQVLVNLLGNAVKFTERGAVELRLWHEEAGGGRLWFSVSDQGIGIPTEAQSRVFEAFTQADSSTTRRYGGTGLGLAISRRMVEALGGKISLESTPGEGSIFTFWVASGWSPEVGALEIDGDPRRVRPPELAPEPAPRAAAHLPVRILLAEDGPDNQRLIGELLRSRGAQVELASDGEQALERFALAEAAGEPFALVLMDMQMPLLDGYAATRELRRRGASVPILALTAHATTEDRQRCLAAGCDDFASKPIQRAELLALVARWAGEAKARSGDA
jgi:signal transduction histidine kinase/CheY-like chemotaxis protein